MYTQRLGVLTRSCLALLFASLLVFYSVVYGQPAPCPSPAPNPPLVTISPTLPADVCIPSPPPAGVPFAFFDDFSWRSFVAMIWPAQQGSRGTPDLSAQPGGSGPLVFETLKGDWEVFQPNGAAPAAWNSYMGSNPCPNVSNLQFGDLVLASFTKFGNVGQAGFGDLVGPLPAQNNTYTRYLTAFNEVEFAEIVSNQWYLKKNLGSVTFTPDGQGNNPIDVKSAWMVVTPGMDTSRYYTRPAWVYDLVNDTCSMQTVALVGLHIVTKTPSRPQWIWSTFMQIDSVPGTPGSQSPFSYNDGSGTAMPARNPITYPPPDVPPQVFNVTQLMPTAPSTQETSAKYQAALAKLGSGVWQYYTLVMTQWPIVPNSPGTPGTPPNTFPGSGATTAFANPLLETFDQARITSGCMSCHSLTTTPPKNTDFLWSLALNAFPSPLGTSPSQPQFHAMTSASQDLQVQQLKQILLGAQQAMAESPKTQKTPPPQPKPNL